MPRINLTILYTFLLAGLLGVITPGALCAAQQAKRIKSNIDDGRRFVLKGNVRPVIANALASDQGEVAASKIMPKMAIHFVLTAAQQADLKQLLAAQQDRRSPQFHKFLTPEQYAARFGLNTADIQKITVWLEDNGFSNVRASRSRTWVESGALQGKRKMRFIHPYTITR